MAILPVNQMIQTPDYAGSLQQGIAFGQQQRAVKQQIADKNQLRTLAPQIIAGDPGAYDQAAAISPDAANAYQGAGDNQLRRLKGFITYVDQARASGKPEAVNAALQAGSGFLGRFIGKPGPTAWTPDMEPGWEQLKAKVAMLDGAGLQGRVQSTYVDDKGQRIAIMADGTQKVLGGNDSGMSQQTISIPGPDGRPRQYTFDKRTGNYVPAGEGGVSSALGAPPAAPGTNGNPIEQGGTDQIVKSIAEQANRMIAAGVPAEQVDAWAASQQGAQPVGGGGLQTTQAVVGSPSVFVGRSPEEEAAAVAAAKLQAENNNFGQKFSQESAITDMKTQAEIDAARQKAEQTTSAVRETTRRENAQTLGVYEAAVKGLKAGLQDASTGPIVGRLPALTADQQIADGGVAAMAPILKQLFRTAGEGTFTDKDQELLLAMVPTRQDLPASRASKLANIDRIVRAKLASPSGGASPAAPMQRARNPQTGEVLVLRNGQWVPE